MPSTWKIIIAFIREMILGKMTFKQAFKENKLRLAFFVIVLISFYLNYLTLPKVYSALEAKATIERSYKEQLELMETKIKECRKTSVHEYQPEILDWCLRELNKYKDVNSLLEQP